MRGAPITIRCDCGTAHSVPYGERWTCPKCGSKWDTAQIPADEYWSIMRAMRRYRIWPPLVAILIAGVFTTLGLFAGSRFLIAMPIVLVAWFTFYMPFWRRRLRARTRNLPEWSLHPE